MFDLLVHKDAVDGEPLGLDAVLVVPLVQVVGVVGVGLAAVVRLLLTAAVLQGWRLVLVPAQLEDTVREVLVDLQLKQTHALIREVLVDLQLKHMPLYVKYWWTSS